MEKKIVANFIVLQNIQLNPTNFYIELETTNKLPKIYPGQFVNVEIPENKDVFLRRPFSVFDVDYKKNTLSLLVKILGKGSKTLTEIEKGEKLNLIYPLGKSFSYPDKNEKVLMIGGGSGVAPMLFLAKDCGLPSNNIDILLGAKTSEDHISVERYLPFGEFHFTTEDGSLGEKGFVTQHSVFTERLKSFDKIYCCGPDAMMKAIGREAKKQNIFCEVSLENLMACGFGVCLCCIEPTYRGNLCICTEGPVFNINELKW
jgi:dihydroorotate dehydrogenase electron transfer subunit